MSFQKEEEISTRSESMQKLTDEEDIEMILSSPPDGDVYIGIETTLSEEQTKLFQEFKSGMDDIMLKMQQTLSQPRPTPEKQTALSVAPDSFSVYIIEDEKKKSSVSNEDICISFTPKKAR